MKLKYMLPLVLGASISPLSHAELITFTLVPPTQREDGTALKKTDLLKCRVWDVTDNKKYKSLSSSLLDGPYKQRYDTAGTYKFAGDCTDKDGLVSGLSSIKTVTVKGGKPNPKVPDITVNLSE